MSHGLAWADQTGWPESLGNIQGQIQLEIDEWYKFKVEVWPKELIYMNPYSKEDVMKLTFAINDVEYVNTPVKYMFADMQLLPTDYLTNQRFFMGAGYNNRGNEEASFTLKNVVWGEPCIWPDEDED